MYQKTRYFQRSFLRETSEGLTVGGCINKHGGLKTSYAWPARFMSRLYGKRWQLLSFNTSAAAKTWHRDILTHLRPCTCSWNIRFRHPAGTSPPALWSTVRGAIVLWSLNAAHWATLLLDLRPRRQLYRHIPLCESNCRGPTAQPSVGEHAVAAVGLLDVHLCSRRLVYGSGTLRWINHLHFSYSLDCRTSSPIWLC